MNDCVANAMPLLPGARSAPVGTPNGITDVSSAKFGMKRAGNSVPPMPALAANGAPPCAGGAAIFSGSPNDTKWLRHATSLPLASTRALEVVKARRTVEVVLHVVFARPQQLHRHAGLLRDPRRLDHVVVVEPTAEAAAAARACGS